MHYVDCPVKIPIRAGLEDLPERFEISQVTEVATGTCASPIHAIRDTDIPQHSPSMPSPLSFSLLTASEGSLADQIAPDVQRWADWTDGLNMLRRDGGHVASGETAGFVQALTEIGLKIKLLGEFLLCPCWTGSSCPGQTLLERRLRYRAVWSLDHPHQRVTFSFPTYHTIPRSDEWPIPETHP